MSSSVSVKLGKTRQISSLSDSDEEGKHTVGSVTEHDTLQRKTSPDTISRNFRSARKVKTHLVTSSVVLEITVVETLSDIGRLLLNSDENVASLVVESLLGRVVSDTLDGVTDDLLVVNVSLGGDLTKDHDQTSLGSGFASDLRGKKMRISRVFEV